MSEIVKNTNDIKERVRVITWLIKLCKFLKELNNFNGLMSILGALNNSTISRLKKTWEVSISFLSIF